MANKKRMLNTMFEEIVAEHNRQDIPRSRYSKIITNFIDRNHKKDPRILLNKDGRHWFTRCNYTAKRFQQFVTDRVVNAKRYDEPKTEAETKADVQVKTERRAATKASPALVAARMQAAIVEDVTRLRALGYEVECEITQPAIVI